ncbi:hypothetical protein ACFW04_014067 [Cataglyphis niger]
MTLNIFTRKKKFKEDRFIKDRLMVNYLSYIGGFNLKEVINFCFKEAVKDSLTPLFTWSDREAICSNQHFEKPTRSEFQQHFRETLRTAKKMTEAQNARSTHAANQSRED